MNTTPSRKFPEVFAKSQRCRTPPILKGNTGLRSCQLQYSSKLLSSTIGWWIWYRNLTLRQDPGADLLADHNKTSRGNNLRYTKVHHLQFSIVTTAPPAQAASNSTSLPERGRCSLQAYRVFLSHTRRAWGCLLIAPLLPLLFIYEPPTLVPILVHRCAQIIL